MDDLISRRAAIEAIVNTVSEIGLHDNSEVARYGATFRQHEIIDIIECVPSAQPERKTGKWIRNDNGTYSCSLCQSWIPEEQHYYARFCLYCGARMEEKFHENV